MVFHSQPSSPKARPPATGVRQSSRRPTGRLQVLTLEDRSVPSAYLETDPAGDFLPTYTGPPNPGLDVVAHEAVLLEDRVVFAGRMAGPIAPTQAIGGLYLFGVDRGQGTPRFLNSPAAPPAIGPNVVWDAVLRINPNGTGNFNNLVAGVNTPLNPADIHISGDEFTASVPLSLLTPAATRPPQDWTYNLWPRTGVGQNVQVSDLAPDDGNAPFQTIAPARVAAVAVNDGSAQRSMVTSLTVAFDGPVTVDVGAFELAGPAGPVELTVNTSVVDGRTVAVLTFSGPDVLGGSLADGSYSLTIRGDRVRDRWGRALDGDADGSAGGDRADAFHRLFGDADGNGDVDWVDRDAFRAVYEAAGYRWYFDFDADGDVDGHDNGEFSRQFGQY